MTLVLCVTSPRSNTIVLVLLFKFSSLFFDAEMDPRMMMPPRPGGMHMLGRGGGFPPHGGHPMDFYYNPFMEDYYGGGRPPYGNPGT